MSAERVAEIERLLQGAFAPMTLLVKDQSHLHAGHEGAKDGRGHFDVTIVSDRFDGQSRLSRHRMVYAALDSLMASDIHALRINATAPSDSLS